MPAIPQGKTADLTSPQIYMNPQIVGLSLEGHQQCLSKHPTSSNYTPTPSRGASGGELRKGGVYGRATCELEGNRSKVTTWWLGPRVSVSNTEVHQQNTSYHLRLSHRDSGVSKHPYSDQQRPTAGPVRTSRACPLWGFIGVGIRLIGEPKPPSLRCIDF